MAFASSVTNWRRAVQNVRAGSRGPLFDVRDFSRPSCSRPVFFRAFLIFGRSRRARRGSTCFQPRWFALGTTILGVTGIMVNNSWMAGAHRLRLWKKGMVRSKRLDQNYLSTRWSGRDFPPHVAGFPTSPELSVLPRPGAWYLLRKVYHAEAPYHAADGDRSRPRC